LNDAHRNNITLYLSGSHRLFGNESDRHGMTYFKAIAAKTGLPYRQLINLYLRDCAIHHRELTLQWTP
jgi:hypothetical protein